MKNRQKIKHISKPDLKKEAGFSLIEFLAAITLGAIAIMLISGIFVQTLRLQRKAFFIQRVQENIGLVLEAMAKEIRVSTIATANTGCPLAPVQLLTMTHPVNGNLEYSLSGGAIHRRAVDSNTDTTLSSSGISVTRLGFCISGNALDDGLQPRVTILLSVQNSNGTEIIPIDVQTTVSQRLLSD
ncbi:MAG: prepilin-type N-terminal cleavage/methylation domain-containing protein [Candidatus Yanofskybacteria bacterium]|nr:prepilin-type N-terminal cleavage/methylation domain-containing protein [Candidatus Yanofskybacteria bacterium]